MAWMLDHEIWRLQRNRRRKQFLLPLRPLALAHRHGPLLPRLTILTTPTVYQPGGNWGYFNGQFRRTNILRSLATNCEPRSLRSRGGPHCVAYAV